MSKPSPTCQRFSVPHDNGIFIDFYSAEWCKPCRNIKPYVGELQVKGVLKECYNRTMSASDGETGFKIPMFRIIDAESGRCVRSVQTSNPAELDVVLNLDVD